MKNTTLKTLTLFISLITLLNGCGSNLPIEDDLGKKNYTLVNQSSSNFTFPNDIKDKVIVAGYIFTNCPDICPLTTNNMRLLQERVKKDGITDVHFVAISFDPLVDTPEVLKSYAEVRDIDLGNWTFLTGEEKEISRMMKDIGIVAVPGDTSKVGDKDVIFYIHTDRISLIDKDYKIRKHYPGSSLNIEEIYSDLKTLTK